MQIWFLYRLRVSKGCDARMRRVCPSEARVLVRIEDITA